MQPTVQRDCSALMGRRVSHYWTSQLQHRHDGGTDFSNMEGSLYKKEKKKKRITPNRTSNTSNSLNTTHWKHATNTRTHTHSLTQTSFSCRDFGKRGKCMWNYGNEVCFRSTLDAEVGMSGAGWMYRITKNTQTHTCTCTHTHTHTYLF